MGLRLYQQPLPCFYPNVPQHSCPWWLQCDCSIHAPGASHVSEGFTSLKVFAEACKDVICRQHPLVACYIHWGGCNCFCMKVQDHAWSRLLRVVLMKS